MATLNAGACSAKTLLHLLLATLAQASRSAQAQDRTPQRCSLPPRRPLRNRHFHSMGKQVQHRTLSRCLLAAAEQAMAQATLASANSCRRVSLRGSDRPSSRWAVSMRLRISTPSSQTPAAAMVATRAQAAAVAAGRQQQRRRPADQCWRQPVPMCRPRHRPW